MTIVVFMLFVAVMMLVRKRSWSWEEIWEILYSVSAVILSTSSGREFLSTF